MTAAARRLMLGLITLLTLSVLLEWVAPASEGPQVAAGVRLARSGAKTPLAIRAVAAWENTILLRPLFSISRRPPRVAAGPQGSEALDTRLSGIMIGTFGRRAIFAPSGGGKPLVLGENDPVNDSTIKRIEPTDVLLANGMVLHPSFDKNRVPTAYVPPPFQPGMVPGQPMNGMPPAPGFPLPRFVQQPQPQPQQDGSGDGQPPPQVQPPLFRGQFVPNRRE